MNLALLKPLSKLATSKVDDVKKYVSSTKYILRDWTKKTYLAFGNASIKYKLVNIRHEKKLYMIARVI